MPTPERSSGHIHLLLPELSDLLAAGTAEAIPDFAATLMAVVARESSSPRSLQTLLADAAPLAAFAWCHDGDGQASADQADYVLRADPVHMQADMNRVHLLQVADFGLQPEQADALIDALQPLFTQHDMQLVRGADDSACERWYLLTKQSQPEAWMPPWRALGRPLEHALQSRAANRFWLRLQSEAQMLMHQHAVNQERQQQGLPALNSLWFWGGGSLPQAAATDAGDNAGNWQAAHVQSPQAAGYCRWLQLPQRHMHAPGTVLQTLPQQSPLLLEWRIDRQRSQPDNWQSLLKLLVLLLNDRHGRRLRLQSVADRSLQLLPAPIWRRLSHALRARLPQRFMSTRSDWQQQLRWLADTSH